MQLKSQYIVIAITSIHEDENLDRFCDSLKPMIYLEVLQTGSMSSRRAVRIVLNVDHALHGTGMFRNPSFFNQGWKIHLTDIGNAEKRLRSLRKAQRDLENGIHMSRK